MAGTRGGLRVIFLLLLAVVLTVVVFFGVGYVLGKMLV
jgi:hypothetical protein